MPPPPPGRSRSRPSEQEKGIPDPDIYSRTNFGLYSAPLMIGPSGVASADSFTLIAVEHPGGKDHFPRPTVAGLDRHADDRISSSMLTTIKALGHLRRDGCRG